MKARWVWGSAAAALTAAAAVVLVPAPTRVTPAATIPTLAPSVAEVCARFGPGRVAGHVANGRLNEISGLVASRRYPGVYWTHNDSGGKPEVFALRLDGTNLGSYSFPGATAIDWEDIGIGPKFGASGPHIYAADIGDNAAEIPGGLLGPRDHVTIYRAPEPSVMPAAPGAPLAGVDHFNLIYPNGPADAEALAVDPKSGDLVIVTKSILGTSRVLMAPAKAMVNGATITMEDSGTVDFLPPIPPGNGLPGTLVTGLDISWDGSLILVRTYQSIFAFPRAKNQSVPVALHGKRSAAPQTHEDQGESIAIASDMSSYATISEGLHQPINVFPIRRARS